MDATFRHQREQCRQIFCDQSFDCASPRARRLYGIVPSSNTLSAKRREGKNKRDQSRSARFAFSLLGKTPMAFFCYYHNFTFLALSLMGEYGFDSTLIERGKARIVHTQVPFAELKSRNVGRNDDYSWFWGQTRACGGILRASRQRDNFMQEINRVPHRQTEVICINWTRTLRNDSQQRFVNACKEAGGKARLSFMNWTQTISIRGGAMTVGPEYKTIWLASRKPEVEAHGILFGLEASYDAEAMLMNQQNVDQLFALYWRRQYIPAFSYDLKAIFANFGKANRTRPVFVVLDGKGSSCAVYINNARSGLLCLTTTEKSVGSWIETVLRVAFTKGKRSVSEFKKNSTITVDARALWAYLEVPALESDTRDVLLQRRALGMYVIATWPRLAFMSGRYVHDAFLDDVDMVRLTEMLISRAEKETMPFL